MIFKNIFFKFMNNTIFGRTIKNVIKYRDIKLVTKGRRINYLVLEPNCHTTKSSTEYLLARKKKKNADTNE